MFIRSLKVAAGAARFNHREISVGKITSTIFATLNEVTGLSKVVNLKDQVQNNYKELQNVRDSLVEKKADYGRAIEERASCQSEINSLLQRKAQWNSTDISRFTSLCQSEHEFTREERESKEAVARCEAEVETKQLVYDSLLRERYQEEIILGERNKGISNILTWSLLLLNTCIFLYSQTVTEPQRGRAVEGKVQRIIDVMQAPLNSIDANVKELMNTSSSPNADPSVQERGSEPVKAAQEDKGLHDLNKEKLALSSVIGVSVVGILALVSAQNNN